MFRALSDLDISATEDALFKANNADPSFPELRPLLAHYTTLPTFEAILKKDEIWFSHPSWMNDSDEVVRGITEAWELVPVSEDLQQACLNEHRLSKLKLGFFREISAFTRGHFRDIYIFSASEIEEDDNRGSLSMWRAYAEEGSGVAIVFDTEALKALPDSPLIIDRVRYVAPEERIHWILAQCGVLAQRIIDLQPDDARLTRLGTILAESIKLAAIFSKHIGFFEEQEWRVVYMGSRDPHDRYVPCFSYNNGPRGIEPKLKLPLRPEPGLTSDDLSIERIVKKVIVGPSRASDLVGSTVRRMIRQCGKSELAKHVVESDIPYRPSRR